MRKMHGEGADESFWKLISDESCGRELGKRAEGLIFFSGGGRMAGRIKINSKKDKSFWKMVGGWEQAVCEAG